MQFDFRDVGSRLKVRPRILGNLIEVKITPEVSYRSKEGDGVIEIDKLSTTVVVSNGQSVQIGGGATRRAVDKGFDDLFYRDERGEAVTITLTPRIME